MMDNMTPVVKQLLIINIIFFIGSQFVGDTAYDLFSLYYFENNNFKFWQPITHMFMHAEVYKPNSFSNISHILFNMFALVSFGSLLENIWGSKKFLFFYISAGLGATLLHLCSSYYFVHSSLNEISNINLSHIDLNTLLNANYKSLFDGNGQMVSGNIKQILDKFHFTQEQFNILMKSVEYFQTPAVGASGAVYGLLVAFAFLFPNAQLSLMFIPVPVKAKYFVPIYMLLYDGFFGILGNSFLGMNSGVAHFAHVGGALIGFIIMWYWKKNSFNDKRWN